MFRPSALSDLKVLEYGDMVPGAYCARLLADAGADVVKVEPPTGDSARHTGPFPGNVKDADWSGLYLYLNANKRGITLDIRSVRSDGNRDPAVAGVRGAADRRHPRCGVARHRGV